MRFVKELGRLLGAAIILGCAGGKSAAVSDSTAAVVSTAPGSAAEANATSSAGRNAGLAAATRAERQTVLFLGTSLTAGLGLDPDSAFPQQLQRKIDARALPYETVNAGVSGETAAGLLRRLDWVLQRPAAVIVVETGANDGLRGQPVEGTKRNIGEILARIKRNRPEAKVLLVQMEAPTNLGASYTGAFHAMFPALAMQYGVTLLPFLLDGIAGHAELNQPDGVHPNAQGERRVAENVWRGLERELHK